MEINRVVFDLFGYYFLNGFVVVGDGGVGL